MHRARLFDDLDAGVRGPLTLVAAQAGAGKTVLLSSWVAAGRFAGPVAWLTLDADDGDPGRFRARVLAALRRSGVPEDVLGTLPAGRASTDRAPGDLLADAFQRLPDPVVLVLDDLHAVGTPPVLAVVQDMLHHAASRLRLVISTRVDPDLPQLPRLRLADQLVELRTADLAFTAPEAAELLEGHGVELSATDLLRVTTRTEGWAAGLRLAALWLQHRPDPTWDVETFAGSDRTVADYLVAEILDQQPPGMRDFLLRTSVVDRISGSLANALTGGHDGDRALASLERANAFIGAVDPDRTWYRYHPLFADLLRFELRSRAPEDLLPLHQRAARWYAAHGAPTDALRHALDAQDWAYSVDLLAQHGLAWVLAGQTWAIRDAARRLPPDVLRESPELGLLVAFERLESLDHDAVGRYLELARQQQTRVPEQRRSRFMLLLALLELVAARRSGDYQRVLDLGPEILAQQISTADVAEDDVVRAVALRNLGAAKLWTGDFDGAEGHLRLAADLTDDAGLDLLRLGSLSLLALLHAVRGRLRAAHRNAQAAAELAAAHGWSEHHDAVGAHLTLAVLHLERGDPTAADRHVTAAVASCAASPLRPLALGVAIVRGWICQARGDPAGGLAALDATRRDDAGRDAPAPHWLVDWTTVTEAELNTATGDIARAQTLLDGVDPDRAGHGIVATAHAVAHARIQLARGDAAAAVRTLTPCLDGSAATASQRPLIAAWLANATAAHRLGDDAAATRSIERALILAEPDGFRQVFADGGPTVRALLAVHLGHATSHRSFLGMLLDHVPASERDGGGPVEPLSERERVVLRYLPSRLSAAEIADELYLSVHTVKSHLRNVYRKLEAGNRREAVARAQQLHLL